MKNQVSWIIIINSMMICLTSLSVLSQAPQSISYQAIVRDMEGNPLANQPVSIRITLHQNSETGVEVYSEIHTVTTNALGLINLQIGQGAIVFGNFSVIEWGLGEYYLELELDTAGGINYVPIGNTQLVSVPYALFSEKTGDTYSAGSGIDIIDHTIHNTAPDQDVMIFGDVGISVSDAYPQFTITNTMPDQSVNMNSGYGINVTGTYPDFTVTNTAPNANHTGDAVGSEALTVARIQGRPISATAPTLDQVLKWNGSQWIPATISAGNPGWSLTGNSGTDPGLNFLGTTDNQPLRFRINNQLAGEINAINNNTFMGYQAGYSITTGSGNVFLGYKAGYNETGSDKLYIANSQTNPPLIYGDFSSGNLGIGTTSPQFKLDVAADARINGVRLGSGAGNNSKNTAVGEEALNANTTGLWNVACGNRTLVTNTEGRDNTACGAEALEYNSTGDYNSAFGSLALDYNQSGDRNTAVGMQALQGNLTGFSNVAIGYQALLSNTIKNNLVAVGDSALYNNGINASESLHATYNTAVGSKALYSNTNGYHNVASGYKALRSNTTGYSNTATGHQALYSNESGNTNSAFGKYALYYDSEDDGNTGIGFSAGDYHISSHSTFLGYQAYPSAGGYQNCMALGYNARVNASNKAVIGNTSITSIGGYANWTNFSDGRFKKNVREDVPGLEFIRQLRPVTYTLDVTSLDADLNKNRPASLREGEVPEVESSKDIASREAKEKIVYTGFIAQEVEATAHTIGYDFSGVDTPQNPEGHYGLRYAEFVVPLVKAVQELQAMIEELQKKVAALEAEVGNRK